ncbi:polysaccharide pyruvyl transferase family protein [Aerococcus kribbianus]|uniref:Polysaccharide pyruvyl transferase family protein n=1 Tax=Aerococcus kribbianus TaxID=2999064 RepID=A0A9X3FW35_9LACT|nr:MULTISPECIES: polysaccharide pyruvyl transferase family protein [unclassified Aerococcus]MCZ0717299.1 polysaccharide pyruvyl transferase family protein [Aerococcus sp. YH-aer221]MCZ0725587.1 polysaccharide pyruvyl transferase family protein [Aerococcus sp. YH-aer222]
MSKYYVVLTGAQKNAGDYLITERCKQILRRERPDYELVQLSRSEALEPHLELINNANALILMGGPAVSRDFYPTTYRLTEDLDDIKVPIIPMAVGWNSKGGSLKDALHFSFNEKSKQLLNRFKNNGASISVRDAYTKTILNNSGIHNVLLTGCASWYVPDCFDYDLRIKEVKKIAITPAQDVRFSQMSKDMMKTVQEEYPEAEIICVFHRGIGKEDQFTSAEDAKNTQDLADYAQSLGINSYDIAFSYDNYAIYDDVDMHIGFRLHAHLYFLSYRKPSLMLHEDGRGKSMSDTIGLKGVDAFLPSLWKKAATASNLLLKRLKSDKRLYADLNPEAIEELRHLINMHRSTGYHFMNGVYKNFDDNYAIMQEFTKQLP